MNSYLKTKTLYFDVAVAGGGMTGICAAIAAARGGAKVALIHDRPVLGGNASGEVRMHICGANSNMKKPELTEGGILHELLLANKRVNDSYNFSIWDAVLFDAVKKEKNLTLFLNTAMHHAAAENGVVERLECYQLTTELHLTVHAKFFIDCTGNGSLCAFSGAEFRTGSEGQAEYGEPHAPLQADNRRMGNTLLFKAVDKGEPAPFVPPVKVIRFTEEQLRFRKHAPDIDPALLKNITPEELRVMFGGYARDYGYWWIEICGEQADIIDEYEEIRDQLVAAIYGVWDHIKNGGEHGAENYELTWVGMLPGVRESRRIVCDYMLTENDVLSNRRFEDAVAYGGWDIDVHMGLFAFDQKPSFIFPVEGAYDIPYRSYCVKGFKNLFVGGRCMGASKLAMSSTRVMGTCAIGGQAIGTAAAMLTAKGETDIRSLDIPTLQQTLLHNDCYLPTVAPDTAQNLAARGTLTATGEQAGFEAFHLLNGVNRKTQDGENAWRSLPITPDCPAVITFTPKKEETVHTLQLVFDSNFNIEKKITLSSTRQKQQVPGVPKELVKAFEVRLIRNGEVVKTLSVQDNFQRLVRLDLGETPCTAVEIAFTETHGDPCARVFALSIG